MSIFEKILPHQEPKHPAERHEVIEKAKAWKAAIMNKETFQKTGMDLLNSVSALETKEAEEKTQAEKDQQHGTKLPSK